MVEGGQTQGGQMKLAIITGTTRGIGAALKTSFDAAGWKVVSLNRPAFDLLRIDLDQVDGILADLSNQAWKRAVFVNNAASLTIASASGISPDQARTDIEANVISPILLIASFLRAFGDGEVANITSVAATAGMQHKSIYCASKAALEGYLRALQAEGVKCYNLNPGAVDTDMQAMIRSSAFPGVEKFIALKESGELKSAQMVARNFVWQIDRA